MALFANDGNKAEKAEKGFDKPPPPTMSIPLPNIQTPINCPRSGSSMNEDAQGTSSGDSMCSFARTCSRLAEETDIE